MTAWSTRNVPTSMPRTLEPFGVPLKRIETGLSSTGDGVTVQTRVLAEVSDVFKP